MPNHQTNAGGLPEHKPIGYLPNPADLIAERYAITAMAVRASVDHLNQHESTTCMADGLYFAFCGLQEAINAILEQNVCKPF